MTKLSTTYRLIVFALLCCVCVESVLFFSNEQQKSTDTEQQDSNHPTIKASQPEAVLPASGVFHLVKWVSVNELFAIESANNNSLLIEQLHLVLSYFEVLFEVCIATNAP